MRTLLLGALALLLAPASQAQDWQLDPTYGYAELSEGFLPDPHQITFTAGGGTTPAISGCDFGYIAEAPDYDLYYQASGGSTLYIYALSDADATLLVSTPSETWVCDDDGLGDGDPDVAHPLVIIPNAEGGLYDIWVGTYSEDPAEATLYISEEDPRGN